MNASKKLTALIVTLSGCLAAATACTDDSPRTRGTDAGTGGAAGGGAGGSATGGGGAGGASDAATDASGGTDSGEAGPDGAGGTAPGCSYSADAGPADASGLSGIALVAGTDYATITEVTAVSLTTRQILGRVTVADGDAIPAASNGVGFVLERTAGALDVLSAAGTVTHRVALAAQPDAGNARTNPHHVVVVPGSTPRKAYVSLYDANAIAVVDVDSGTVTKTLDVSGLQAPSDTDGSVEVDSGVFDATTGRVYFLLDRIDQSTIVAPSYELACPTAPALVVAIDPATDTLVDLNGSDAGTGGIPLGLVSHGAMVRDPAAPKAYVVAAGCFRALADGGTERVSQGVEEIDFTTGAVTSLFTATSGNYLSDLEIVAPGAGVLQSFDANYATLWNGWSASSSALGASYLCVPDAATAAGTDSLVGAVFSGSSASLVDYRLSQGGGSILAGGLFQSTGLVAIAGVAVVK